MGPFRISLVVDCRWLRRLLLVLVALTMGAAAPLKSPPGVYAFRTFRQAEGLANQSTTALAQDREGFLWAGTEDGLFRLEGDRLRRFGEEDGLPSATILDNGLSAGLHHGLWISTNRGLVFWDGRRFLRPSALGLSGKDDHRGLSLAQGGIILSDPQTETHYLSLDGEPFVALKGLPWNNRLVAGTYDRLQGRLVLCLRQELWILEKQGWQHRDLAGVLGQDVRAVWVDQEGQIWLRTLERLIRLPNLDAPPENIALPAVLSAMNSVSLGMDVRGRLWTNTAQGLVWVDGSHTGVLGYAEGLPQGGARVLLVDQQGTVWIAGEGIHKLLGDGLWTGFTRRQGLPAEVVWAISRTQDGLLWAGTSSGLAPWDGHRWQVLPRTDHNWFLALGEDAEGNLWVGHTPSSDRPTGLSVRPKGTFNLLPVSVPGLPSRAWVRALQVQGTTLWLGTPSTGLFRAVRAGLRLQVEPVVIGNWPREDGINQLTQDGNGGLWVAGNHGLAHWNGRAWTTLDKSSGLLDTMVLQVASTTAGEAWVSYGELKGLSRVRWQQDRLEVLQSVLPPHPLVRNPIVTLAARADGNLWVSTSAGLLRWDGQRVEAYGRHTGLPGDDCAQNALWFDANGDVWVGLSVGLARGHLGQRPETGPMPSCQIFEAARGDGSSMLGDSGEAQVQWKARTLTFRYGPHGSRQVEGLRFQVRLVGLEDAWRTTTFPEARYSSIEPGHYRFEVRVLNGVDETGPATVLKLQIRSPWWMTWWFRLGVGWAVVVLILLGMRYRLRSLKRRNAELEDQVQVRTRDLETAMLALRDALRRFEDLVKNVPLGMIDWDPELRVKAWNPAAEGIFGYLTAEVLGQQVEALLFPERAQGRIREAFQLRLEGRGVHLGSGSCLTKGGHIIQCEWTNTPIWDSNGELVGITSLVEDVTEKRRAEEALRFNQKLESLGTVAGGIAHDFNNLLAAISGNAELALQKDGDGTAAVHLQRILATSERAAGLAKQMLVYAGRAPIQPDAMDLNLAVSEGLGLLKAKLTPAIRLDLQVEVQPAWVAADQAQFQVVLECLVTNALEAMADRPGTLRVSVSREHLDTHGLVRLLPTLAFEPGPCVVVTVADTGCGMDAATLERIFDPFFSTKFQGRGMGLPVLLGILRSHRAGLSVESAPGRGSTFRLYLQASDGDGGVVPNPSPTPVANPAGSILFVDDEPVLRELALEALSTLGHPVLLASGGAEAVAICAANPEIRLVITDLMMPGMGGLEACQLIHQQDPTVRVILSSGYTEDNLRDGAGSNFEAFIQKPYRLQDLLALARRFIG